MTLTLMRPVSSRLLWNFCLFLTLSSLMGVALSESVVDSDFGYCKSSYSNRSSFLSTNYTASSGTILYTLGANSNIIRFFLSFNLVDYISSNIISLIPWLLLVSLAILGWFCCSGMLLINIIRKERYILTPMEKKAQEKAEKKTKKKEEKVAKDEDADGSGDEEEEDEEDNFEDVDDDPVKLIELSKFKNHPDFRRRLNFDKRKRVFDSSWGPAILLSWVCWSTWIYPYTSHNSRN